MSKTHDAVLQLESTLPTVFQRMLQALGLMKASHEEIAKLHEGDENDEIDSAAVLAQVKTAQSLGDQLTAAINEAQSATTAAASAVQASTGATDTSGTADAGAAAGADTGSAASATTTAADPAAATGDAGAAPVDPAKAVL